MVHGEEVRWAFIGQELCYVLYSIFWLSTVSSGMMRHNGAFKYLSCATRELPPINMLSTLTVSFKFKSSVNIVSLNLLSDWASRLYIFHPSVAWTIQFFVDLSTVPLFSRLKIFSVSFAERWPKFLLIVRSSISLYRSNFMYSSVQRWIRKLFSLASFCHRPPTFYDTVLYR